MSYSSVIAAASNEQVVIAQVALHRSPLLMSVHRGRGRMDACEALQMHDEESEASVTVVSAETQQCAASRVPLPTEVRVMKYPVAEEV
jgi:hypothetical protein